MTLNKACGRAGAWKGLILVELTISLPTPRGECGHSLIRSFFALPPQFSVFESLSTHITSWARTLFFHTWCQGGIAHPGDSDPNCREFKKTIIRNGEQSRIGCREKVVEAQQRCTLGLVGRAGPVGSRGSSRLWCSREGCIHLPWSVGWRFGYGSDRTWGWVGGELWGTAVPIAREGGAVISSCCQLWHV